MAGGRPSAFDFFTCLNCKALYQFVKVDAGPETVDRALRCVVCGTPLASREGEFVLKYFLLRKLRGSELTISIKYRMPENDQSRRIHSFSKVDRWVGGAQ